MSKTVLLVADEALYIYAQKGKGLNLIEAVPWDSANFENNVAQIIAKDCKGRPVVVINDMVEQHYRKEMINKNAVGLLDKKGYIRQELVKAFPNYPIRSGLLLKEKVADGKVKGGEVYIFAAVPNSEQFQKSTGAVRESMALVSGFTLLPVESASMVKALSDKLAGKRKKKARWAVFIGQHKNGSVRQIVTKDGELALTRMSPIVDNDSNPQQWAQELAQEFKATMSYLARFGYNEEDGLDVMAIANPSARELLQGFIDTPCNLTILGSGDACKMLGLKVVPQTEQRHADIVHAAWAASRKTVAMPLDAPTIGVFVNPRNQARIAARAFVLAGIVTSFLLFTNLQEVASLRSEVNDSRNQESRFEAEYETEVKRLEALGLDIKLIKGSLSVYERLQANEIQGLPLFKAIGLALGRDLRIDRLEVSRQRDLTTSNLLGLGSGDDGDEASANADLVFEVSMRMTYPSTTDIDQGNQEVADFRDRLQRYLPDYQVEVVKFLKDFEYTEQVVFETGDLETNDVAQDYIAEVVIKGVSS